MVEKMNPTIKSFNTQPPEGGWGRLEAYQRAD